MKYTIHLILLFLGVVVSSLAWSGPAMVWSEYENPGVNIYYSPDSARTIAITSSGINVLPNLFHTERTTWITWVDKTDSTANRLMYAHLSADGSLLESGSLPTEHGRIYAPAIAVDQAKQRVWLVWVENNGLLENLYASFLDIPKPNGKVEWRPALRITPDDKTHSNNMPVIDQVLPDRIAVSWLRSSPASFEDASAEILATQWEAQATTLMLSRPSAKINAASGARYRALKLSPSKDTQRLIKRLDRARSLTADDQAWKAMTRGKEVLTGAVHSDNGTAQRLSPGTE